jgi:hypothetical protein
VFPWAFGADNRQPAVPPPKHSWPGEIYAGRWLYTEEKGQVVGGVDRRNTLSWQASFADMIHSLGLVGKGSGSLAQSARLTLDNPWNILVLSFGWPVHWRKEFTWRD